MSLFVPSRRPSRELLDDARLAPEEMAASLRDLENLNRRWGAARALAGHLRPRLLREPGRSFTILDVGAGAGSVARSLARRLRAGGIDVAVVAADLQWRHLAAGRVGEDSFLPAFCADAFALPLPDASVDWAVSTLFLHHFSPEENVCLLKELARVARCGVAMLDVRRHLLPLLFVAIAGRLTFETGVSVADGQASVRQAYTPREAQEIAGRALPGARTETVFPFRLLVTAGGGRRAAP
jgi:SAM-dependent methyltransferase